MDKNAKRSLFFTILLLFKGLFDLLVGSAMTAGSILCMADGIVAYSPYLMFLHLLGVSESSDFIPIIFGIVSILCALILLGIVIFNARYLLKVSTKAPTFRESLLLVILSLITFISGFFSFTSITLIAVEGLGILVSVFASITFTATKTA